MGHWMPTYPDSKILYNDLRDGKFVSIILDINTKEERIIPYPISALSHDGKWMVNESYPNPPAKYGLFLMNMETRPVFRWAHFEKRNMPIMVKLVVTYTQDGAQMVQ